MRVVVLGATGNVGTALLDALCVDERIEEIVGFARRAPAFTMPKVRWVTGDVRSADLAALLDGAAAAVRGGAVASLLALGHTAVGQGETHDPGRAALRTKTHDGEP